MTSLKQHEFRETLNKSSMSHVGLVQRFLSQFHRS